MPPPPQQQQRLLLLPPHSPSLQALPHHHPLPTDATTAGATTAATTATINPRPREAMAAAGDTTTETAATADRLETTGDCTATDCISGRMGDIDEFEGEGGQVGRGGLCWEEEVWGGKQPHSMEGGIFVKEPDFHSQTPFTFLLLKQNKYLSLRTHPFQHFLVDEA